MLRCRSLNDRQDKSNKIFNPGLALSILAISLPFSAFTIVWIYSSGDFFASPIHLIGLSAITFVTSCVLLKRKASARQPASVPYPKASEVDVDTANQTSARLNSMETSETI